jgi:hypothetical protein|tara:strand:+ start:860 stop:997 length:138 start_codon:yes stop_codon:yes gene_type:complete
MSEQPIEHLTNEFWVTAHEFTVNAVEEEFANEMAYIMTSLHEEGC